MLFTVQLEPCLYYWMKEHWTVHCINHLQNIMCFNIKPLKVGLLIFNFQKFQACSKWDVEGGVVLNEGEFMTSQIMFVTLLAWAPQNESLNPRRHSWSQSSWGGFYKELVKPYREVVIDVRDGVHQGAVQTASEVHKVEADKLKDKCKVDFRIVNGG